MSWVARLVLPMLLVGHGVAHLPGFLVAWQLREFPGLPYTTTVARGAIEIGPAGTRVLGVLWLGTGLACLVAAGGILAPVPWSSQLTWAVLAVSTLLCVLGWPAARLGLVANSLIAALLLVAGKLEWLARNTP